jgi:hypothetical protein
LKGQYGGGDASRHEYAIARPRKKPTEYEDDDPTYVYEETNETVSKAELDDLLKEEVNNDAAEESKEPRQPVPTSTDILEDSAKVEAVGIGAKRKKRGGKLVGQATDNQDGNDIQIKRAGIDGGSDAERPKQSVQRKKKRKIKLSFDED